MASFSSPIQCNPGDTDVVDTEAKVQVGTTQVDANGNVYVYGKGVASCVAGDWVSFDEAMQATLLVANAKGRVGVAMDALIANTYGWFQIAGKNTIAKALTGFADNGLIYATSTAGSVDDAVVTGDLIVGAIGRSAVSGGVITVELSYPFATDVLG